MTELIAVEAATGAQILPLPRVQDPRQTISNWAASCCLSADRRLKYQSDRDLAARIIITTLAHVEQEGQTNG